MPDPNLPQDTLRNAQVRDTKNIPPEEQTPNKGDDAEAKQEVGEDVLTRAPAAPQWRVAKGLLALRDQVNAKAPKRSKLSDGTIGDALHATRNSDHNPWVRDGGVGVVTALDITHDPADGCDADLLAEAIRRSQDDRVKYIIWNRRIASSAAIAEQPPWQWRPYSGKNPHDKHVHISVKADKGSYDSTAAWRI